MPESMSDLATSIAAIQEFFVTQDKCRDAQADEACDVFLDEVARLEHAVNAVPSGAIDLVQLAEIWPLLELRDAMLAAQRTMCNLNGEATIILKKAGANKAHSYGESVTLLRVDALDAATAAAKRIAMRSARKKRLSRSN